MAIVSHDLKNPLATIQMAVQFLLEDGAPNDSVHEPGRAQLQVIYRSAKSMYRLVHDLLDAAAMEVGQLAIDPTSNVRSGAFIRRHYRRERNLQVLAAAHGVRSRKAVTSAMTRRAAPP